MSAPTTLLVFCHAREVAWYCPVGVQGTILDIAVDLSALPYFFRLFPGPYLAGVSGRLVPVSSDCASWRGAVSRGSARPRSEKRVGVVSGVWPGFPVGEVVRRRARDRSEHSGRRGGPEPKAGAVPPRSGLPVGDQIVLLAYPFSYLGQPRSCALSSWAEPLFWKAGPRGTPGL